MWCCLTCGLNVHGAPSAILPQFHSHKCEIKYAKEKAENLTGAISVLQSNLDRSSGDNLVPTAMPKNQGEPRGQPPPPPPPPKIPTKEELKMVQKQLYVRNAMLAPATEPTSNTKWISTPKNGKRIEITLKNWFSMFFFS